MSQRISSELQLIAGKLRQTAEGLNLSVADDVELTGQTMSVGSMETSSLKASDLPLESHALVIGRYTIILGLLPVLPTEEAVNESLRRYRNQCVVARSFLGRERSLDLLLILVGPRGSAEQMAWRTQARRIERDDRAARKMVLLLSENNDNDMNDYDALIGRTFLARPWLSAEGIEDMALDELSNTGAISETLPQSTVDAWEQIVLDPEKTPDEIVSALVDAWVAREAT